MTECECVCFVFKWCRLFCARRIVISSVYMSCHQCAFFVVCGPLLVRFAHSLVLCFHSICPVAQAEPLNTIPFSVCDSAHSDGNVFLQNLISSARKIQWYSLNALLSNTNHSTVWNLFWYKSSLHRSFKSSIAIDRPTNREFVSSFHIHVILFVHFSTRKTTMQN